MKNIFRLFIVGIITVACGVSQDEVEQKEADKIQVENEQLKRKLDSSQRELEIQKNNYNKLQNVTKEEKQYNSSTIKDENSNKTVLPNSMKFSSVVEMKHAIVCLGYTVNEVIRVFGYPDEQYSGDGTNKSAFSYSDKTTLVYGDCELHFKNNFLENSQGKCKPVYSFFDLLGSSDPIEKSLGLLLADRVVK